MDEQEIIFTMALSRVGYFKLGELVRLYTTLGSARAVVEHRRDIRDVLPEASPKLATALLDIDDHMRRAEEELRWDVANGVLPICYNDARYPQRLRHCADAPLVLFYKGNAELNVQRVVSIVGTRQCTVYGQDLIRRFVADVRALCPGLLIVSGLAYGVDVCAHRHALHQGLPTVGVLAHGLDDLYPSHHRDTARQMTTQGGLLTEFLTHTRADRMNFVRRNRIVAGMSDACIVVESAAKGGGLITADMARGYDREVFAFPGPIGAPYSEGCNNLIRDNGAALITGADDFVKAMHWEDAAELQQARQQGIERQLFPSLSADEQLVVQQLQQANDLHVNTLSLQAGIAIGKLSALLFELEMKGLVKMLPGSVCHLLG